MSQRVDCQCACAAVKFSVTAPPLVHAYCHCTICQSFNEAPFGDVLLYRAQDVEMPPEEQVDYGTYRSPPAVQRGRCRQCGKPAIEHMTMFPMPKMIFVPAQNVRDPESLPPASMHLFYHRRVEDAQDSLPKYEGYWPSQIAFIKRMLVERMKRRSA